MALVQALAARLAGVDRLAFHTGSAGGGAPLEEAMRLMRDDPGAGFPSATRDVLARIDAMAFEWGASEGN